MTIIVYIRKETDMTILIIQSLSQCRRKRQSIKNQGNVVTD